MFTHIWGTFTERYSFKTFVFVHTVELFGVMYFVLVFYTATFIFSLLKWP